MTSLSTKAMLLKLERDGKIVRFKPRLRPHEKEVRCLFLLPSVHKWLTTEAKTKHGKDLKAAARSHLAEFVKGAPIDNKYYMKQLEPFDADVWEFRPLTFKPVPVCRIFGGFVSQDCFIATHHADKSVINKQSRSAPVTRCKAEWKKLLPNIARLRGKNFDDLVFKGSERDERKKKQTKAIRRK